jgi:PAS domain S-box-containing protein
MDPQPDLPPEALEAFAQRAAEELRESQELISTSFQLIPVALGITRLGDGRFVEVNEAFLRTFRAKPEDILGRTALEFRLWVDPTDRDRVVEEVRAKGEIRDFEVQVRRRDGTIIPVLYSGRKVDLRGEAHLLSVAYDLTAINEARRAQKESRDLFTRVFEFSPEAMILTRLSDRTYIAANAAFEAAFGWSREEILGRTAEELGIWVDLEVRSELFQDLMKNRAQAGREVELRRKDGSTFTALVSACILEVQGEPCILNTGRDITALRREEEALRQTQKLESLGILAGGIAHDFNNLFQAMLANVYLAQTEVDPGSRAAGRLDAVERILHRAEALSRQMLIYAGRGSLTREVFDLSRLISEIPELLKVSVSKKATLELDLLEQPAMLRGDPSQVQQVVLNLVVNASEALLEGEGSIRLRSWIETLNGPHQAGTFILEPALAGPHLLLEVEDDGEGMDQATLDRIFDPFFSTKAPGRGLGLSAILGILRAHQAGIQVWSTPGGGGTRFRLAFPLSAEANPQGALPAQTSSARKAVHQGRILYADDEEEVRTATAALMEILGYKVDQATDGLEAVQLFCADPQNYDLVLLDATMPRMSGSEALAGMLSLRPDLPAVLCTGYTAKADEGTYLAEGFNGVLQKPFTLEELETALARAKTGL